MFIHSSQNSCASYKWKCAFFLKSERFSAIIFQVLLVLHVLYFLLKLAFQGICSVPLPTSLSWSFYIFSFLCCVLFNFLRTAFQFTISSAVYVICVLSCPLVLMFKDNVFHFPHWLIFLLWFSFILLALQYFEICLYHCSFQMNVLFSLLKVLVLFHLWTLSHCGSFSWVVGFQFSLSAHLQWGCFFLWDSLDPWVVKVSLQQ